MLIKYNIEDAIFLRFLLPFTLVETRFFSLPWFLSYHLCSSQGMLQKNRLLSGKFNVSFVYFACKNTNSYASSTPICEIPMNTQTAILSCHIDFTLLSDLSRNISILYTTLRLEYFPWGCRRELRGEWQNSRREQFFWYETCSLCSYRIAWICVFIEHKKCIDPSGGNVSTTKRFFLLLYIHCN